MEETDSQIIANRTGEIRRKTTETDIHMLNHIARHGLMDMIVEASGDLHIDDHHTIEDVGIALGQALKLALGDCTGIVRYGHAVVPMDEALVLCALDVSGRGMSVYELTPGSERVGVMATEMTPEFFRAVAHNAGITLHIRQMAGVNAHHILEAAFKAFGRSLAMAVSKSGRVQGVPSTKGVL
jgi:imidazoleglycerol-phosphate dehydratase